MRVLTFKTTLLFFTAITAFGQGTILWNESVNGPLSQSFLTPTSLGPLQIGTNYLQGRVELQPNESGWTSFNDYFIFRVSPSTSLSAVHLTTDNQQMSLWLGGSAFSDRIGFVLNPANSNLFAQMGIAAISPNFYGMYVQNEDRQPFTSIANYRLDFVVQAIPEPSALAVALVSVMGLVIRWCRSNWKR